MVTILNKGKNTDIQKLLFQLSLFHFEREALKGVLLILLQKLLGSLSILIIRINHPKDKYDEYKYRSGDVPLSLITGTLQIKKFYIEKYLN